MIPGVDVTIVNSLTGQDFSIADGVCGVVLTGNGTGTLALYKPIKVVSLSDAVTQGVTQTAEPEAYKTVKEFYLSAPQGSPLYLMITTNTDTLAGLLDLTNLNGAKRLVDFAKGTIRVLGVMRTPAASYVPATPGFFDSDATAALANMATFQQAYFTGHDPLRILIGARVATESNNTIFVPTTAANSAGGLVAGDTVPGGRVAMGVFLGRIAATTADVNIGRNKDGALGISSWYIGSLPITPPADGSAWYQQLNQLIDSGYITVTTYPQTAGYFISDDPLCTVGDPTNINNLSDGRVADLASIVAYKTYIRELKDNVDVDSSGNITAVSAKYLEGLITQNIKVNIGTKISGNPSVYIPVQQVNSATPFIIQLGVTRKGCLRQIQVQLMVN